MPYVTLSLAQKKAVRDEAARLRAAGERCNQSDLATWAKNRFTLSDFPSKATMSRILSDNNLGRINIGRISKKFRNTRGKGHAIEVAMFNWVCHLYHSRSNVSGSRIREKALHLQALANQQLSLPARTNLTFSVGWLDNFKKRWGLGTASRSTQLGDTVANQLAEIPHILAQYSLKDVWTAAEFGLLYKMAPDKNLAPARHRDRQEKLTFLACCNADASEKLDLLMIGRDHAQTALNVKHGARSPFEYFSNHHAWMTTSLFCNWLARFADHISATPDRKVVLLVVSAGTHGTHETLQALPNVRVVLIPADAAERCSPLHQGVISSFKLMYRKRQLERAVDVTDEQYDDIYQLDVPTAAKWSKAVWASIPMQTVQGAWQKTELLDNHPDAASIPALPQDYLTTLQQTVDGIVKILVPPARRINAVDLVVLREEISCMQQISDEALVSDILHQLEEERIEASETKSKPRASKPPKVPDAAKTEGAKVQGAKAEGAKAEGAKAEGAKSEGAKAEVTKAEVTKAEGTKAEGTKAEGTKAEVNKGEGPMVEGAVVDNNIEKPVVIEGEAAVAAAAVAVATATAAEATAAAAATASTGPDTLGATEAQTAATPTQDPGTVVGNPELGENSNSAVVQGGGEAAPPSEPMADVEPVANGAATAGSGAATTGSVVEPPAGAQTTAEDETTTGGQTSGVAEAEGLEGGTTMDCVAPVSVPVEGDGAVSLGTDSVVVSNTPVGVENGATSENVAAENGPAEAAPMATEVAVPEGTPVSLPVTAPPSSAAAALVATAVTEAAASSGPAASVLLVANGRTGMDRKPNIAPTRSTSELPPLEEQLKAAAIVKRVLDVAYDGDRGEYEEVMTGLRKLQEDLRRQKYEKAQAAAE